MDGDDCDDDDAGGKDRIGAREETAGGILEHFTKAAGAGLGHE